jgi:hypothetical protein
VKPPLYLDENIAEGLGEALRRDGFDALTTTDAGRKGATDPRQLLFAARAGRVLVTYNGADYGMLHEALDLWARVWGLVGRDRHAGILVINQAAIGRGELGIRDMLAVVRQLPAAESAANRFFAWNPRTGFHEPVDPGRRRRRS